MMSKHNGARKRPSVVEECCPVTGRKPSLVHVVGDELSDNEYAQREALRADYTVKWPGVSLTTGLMRTPYEVRRHIRSTLGRGPAIKKPKTTTTQPPHDTNLRPAATMDERVASAHHNAAHAEWKKPEGYSENWLNYT